MGKKLRAVVLFSSIYLFWGLFYPQYALTEDLYEVTDAGQAVEKDAPKDFETILKAEPGEVQVRFALLEEIEMWFGEKETYEDGGNQNIAGDADRSVRFRSGRTDCGPRDHAADSE